MSSREFTRWKAYWRLDPFGNERGDYQAGMVAAAMQNVFAKTARKPSDFLPRFGGGDDEHQTVDEAKRILGIPSSGNDNS